ncbi:DNA replication and repair protein RecF [Nibricoccus aquaticus]|uniref:DNA replication and repair protein RecF n=1 Tax=Nibricoccus aquaticus TaxID=2576891 RepID=A0A290QM83_9BACT|nr:DNA replication/repair protein RecF [Nibricoccus aquaticus]ATC65232.1 DNA replication and repair protein RecF [Nibricoccus aquaticus]
MRLRRLTLQHFRNVAFADLALTGDRHFFVGSNAQGKTNLLEAAGFLFALRSFRTADNRALIAHGQPEAAIACELTHERRGDTRVLIKLRPGGKEVTCDGERVPRLADYLGHFPAVVFSSQDQLLVRGSPGARRRWLDLALAATDATYFSTLQAYHRALAGRNALLKRTASASELLAFEHPLATAAASLTSLRAAGIATLSTHVAETYNRLADSAEPAALTYSPDTAPLDAPAWSALFAKNRPRDLVMKTTLAGPHRDDCELTVSGKPARDFASEGQQRSLALALRLAEVEYLATRTGVQPLLLADDVLGELDPARRRRFWTALGENRQVIATGTTLPDASLGTWQIFNVTTGSFAPS